eukprot:CAMPEP_0119530318 /NCGR_PEP_ID=MMETSP1344-20130328/44169_1 /TAXON_ID=236787 /ORGANISM="Florenciella parvula, Strain CCMP2471" /LENGTH=47 /DNA_ID= /DNA_START= /DNA_END= /DNA_ORIENTATION=
MSVFWPSSENSHMIDIQILEKVYTTVVIPAVHDNDDDNDNDSTLVNR